MLKNTRFVLPAMLAVALISIFSVGSFAAGEKYLSPVSVVASADGAMLFVAQATGERVSFINAATEKIEKTVDVTGLVSGIAVSPNGEKLYVTGGIFDGVVSVIDIKTAKIVDIIEVGHSPIAPVPTPDGKMLYICRRFNDTVYAIDLATKKPIAEITAIREPCAADITDDGKKLFVANFLPAGRVDGDFAAAAVSIIDTATNKVIETVTFPNGSIDLRGLTISPDGKYAYISHILARYQLPTTQLERGWMNTNAMTIIDVAANKLLTTVLLDDVDLGAANPWGLACSADGKYITVAHSGTHEISSIDRIGMHEKLDKVAKGEKVSDVSATLEDVPNDLSFLVGLRRRLKLTGNGPRNLAMIGTKVYVAEYFSDSLGVVDVDPAVRPIAKSIKLGPDVEMTLARKGEMFFNDASLCFQKWQSCATCHPGDARPDALNWDLLNDGMGNPKNTKSMLLSHQTPPSMITGIRASAEIGVRAGIRFIQFAVRPEADAVAIDQYLMSLKPMPSPRLVKNPITRELTLNPKAKRGEKIFKIANCDSCHSGPMFTDMQKYDVGTGKEREEGDDRPPESVFDTPTLVEIWRTAPYLHDGRSGTMKEALLGFNVKDMHGSTSGLTETQIDELAEYILSL